MRHILMLSLLLGGFGCNKEIHEVRAPVKAPQAIAIAH
jgi:hypothetical protein